MDANKKKVEKLLSDKRNIEIKLNPSQHHGKTFFQLRLDLKNLLSNLADSFSKSP